MRQRVLPLLLCIFIGTQLSAQKLWNEVSPGSQEGYVSRNRATLPEAGRFKFYSLNDQLFRTRLSSAKSFEAGKTGQASIDIDFPLADGSTIEAEAFESSIVTPAIQAKLPNVHTYLLVDKFTHSSVGRMTVTPQGITSLLFTTKGTAYISPVGAGNTHITYFTKELHVPESVKCAVNEQPVAARGGEANRQNAGDCQLRTYRLAVAATGEYYEWAGSDKTQALAYIVISINTVNAIYERDAAIRFTLVTTDDIIYTDPLSDPYPSGSLDGTVLDANNTFTDANLGAGSYDVGIVFNNGWSGGLAQLNSVCTVSHGRAGAGITFGTGANPTAGPQGPVFDGTVAHEIGHQFSATHTMAANNGGCLGNTTASTAFEPGGGSTLMAYAGTCTGNYYQFNSDLYFHVANVEQIGFYATSLAGSICPVTTPLSNTAPVVSVSAPSYNIPISTPFFLTASGSDVNGNSLTYSWEQMDANLVTSSPPSPTATIGPNFRPYPPVQSPTRYFPNLPSLVAGSANTYEVLPSVTRTMNFTVNLRDNAAGGGCTAQEDVTVTTNAGGGPFTVTSQSTPVTLTADGSSSFTINWNVAGTTAAPFNTSNVDILFSADGGQNFSYTLLSNTPNDGTQTIVVPNIPTSVGRIMVRAVGNIFFNINTANITIGSSCGAEGATLSPSTTVTGAPGSSVLNLSSTPNYGLVILPTTGAQLTSADPATTLATYSSVSGSCINFSNEFRYDLYTFQVNAAGSYTFRKTAGSYIMNIYSGSFVPGNPCANFIASNGTYNGTTVGISANVTATLTPGISYTLAVGTFALGVPALPLSYTISLFSGPVGGDVYSGYPNPGGTYSYRYVVVNEATGNITAILTTPDLRNSTTFTTGSYAVHGFSFLTADFDAAALNAYVGSAYSVLTNDLFNNPTGKCGNISKNAVTVNISTTLPVALLPLTAIRDDAARVKLYWSTESEMNSRDFDVERSADGANFQTIKTVTAGINTNSRTNYASIDDAPLTGNNYYRIRANSLDGSYEYTNIALVRNDAKEFIVHSYPNPVKDRLTLEIVTPDNNTGQMKITSANGATVSMKTIELKKGLNIQYVDMTSLPSGIYFVKITSSSSVASVKAVKY